MHGAAGLNDPRKRLSQLFIVSDAALLRAAGKANRPDLAEEHVTMIRARSEASDGNVLRIRAEAVRRTERVGFPVKRSSGRLHFRRAVLLPVFFTFPCRKLSISSAESKGPCTRPRFTSSSPSAMLRSTIDFGVRVILLFPRWLRGRHRHLRQHGPEQRQERSPDIWFPLE
jgi:hypothetical protein